MVDDAGAAGGPGGPGGPGMGGRGGFRGGFGSGIRGCGGKAGDKEWLPVTKLGRLVKDMKIKSLEEIYLFSLPIKESEIIDFFLGAALKDKVLKIMPVQKQTQAGQRTRFKVTGRCGSVLVRLIPAPRGTGIISAPVPKKLLLMAGIDDCYTSAGGCTATLGNFAKATFDAISKTYSYLTPDLWKETVFTKSPYQEFTDHLVFLHERNKVDGACKKKKKRSEVIFYMEVLLQPPSFLLNFKFLDVPTVFLVFSVERSCFVNNLLIFSQWKDVVKVLLYEIMFKIFVGFKFFSHVQEEFLIHASTSIRIPQSIML
uniref:Small ribosomal subunit protein uS5 n=1 Tax=Oryctolagus cuniculus TaxID=9986 RepID=A0A5F9D8I1_RABIT